MRFDTSKTFKKQLLKHLRSGTLSKERLRKRLSLFEKDRTCPELKDHMLFGNMIGRRAFSVKGDLRIVYQETEYGGETTAFFLGIGTHSQIYGM